MASPIIGLMLFWMAVFVALLIVNLQKKADLTSAQQETRNANAAPVSVESFTDSLGNVWTLTNISGILQFIWTPPGLTPLVLWDSINLGCGAVNQANYLTYEAEFPNGPSYLQADSLVLGTTPATTNASGVIVTFRLVLYQGDVRIESLTDNSFWSIFPQLNPVPLTSWPSSGSAVMWQSLNVSQNLAAQFLANGDLVTKQVDQVNYYWSASLLASPIPCV